MAVDFEFEPKYQHLLERGYFTLDSHNYEFTPDFFLGNKRYRYDDTLSFYCNRNKEYPMFRLRGRIVRDTVMAILDGSNKEYLEAIMEGCKERLEAMEKT